ncbi:MAG TPA: porphobilinogen synthase, partial [Candidatus Methylacidiphilales bacterium]
LEALLDEEEGADVVMVKPAGPYLDIVREVREAVHVPVAAYQVSGEYAQIVAAGRNGWIDLKKTRDESLLGIRRAGADLILTYFAREWAEDFAKR